MKNLFSGIYQDKTILVTGHNGFKGSWLAYWLSKLGSRVVGCSLEEYPNDKHFRLISNEVTVHEDNVDIRSYKDFQQVVDRHNPDMIFHLAAQALVRDSYTDPLLTFETNVLGTVNLLEAIRKNSSVRHAVIITTDKIYDNAEWIWPYRENDRLGGHDPYSSSKVCTEEIVKSYKRSFFAHNEVKVATARAGNVIGGGDWSKDRLIPDIIRAISTGSDLHIRNKNAVRPWQHVLDSISGYLLLGQKLMEGSEQAVSEYNFGPSTSNCVSVEVMLDLFGRRTDLSNVIFGSSDQFKHESQLLMLDCSKARHELHWEPVWDLATVIDKTANWYLAFLKNKTTSTGNDLETYVRDAREKGLIWTNIQT